MEINKITHILEKLQEFSICDIEYLFDENEVNYIHDTLMGLGCTYFRDTDTYVY